MQERNKKKPKSRKRMNVVKLNEIKDLALEMKQRIKSKKLEIEKVIEWVINYILDTTGLLSFILSIIIFKQGLLDEDNNKRGAASIKEIN